MYTHRLISYLIVFAWLFSGATSFAQPAPNFSVQTQQPDYTVWNSVFSITNLNGSVTCQTNSYTELATGMNIWQSNQWMAASPEIQLSSDGMTAQATNLQHQVMFEANINSYGSIHVVLPGGVCVRSHIMGLSYYDPATSNNVLIAELQDSTGQLVAANQVLYTNAFTDFQADVRYTVTIGGVEQDIILQEQPPDPATFNLSSQSRLQVWSEFVESPVPTALSHTNHATGIADETLNFGTMHMGHSKAFPLNQTGLIIPVAKHWYNLESRNFVVEDVPMNAISSSIQSLPPAGSSTNGQSSIKTKVRMAQNHPIILPRKVAKPNDPAMRMAKTDTKPKGFVLDWLLTLNGNFTNYVFKSDTTYVVTNAINLYGTNVFEGGTVIKFSHLNSQIIINNSNFVFQTGPYRPVIITGFDDNSVGATPSGSTGSVSSSYYYGDNGGGTEGAISLVYEGYSAPSQFKYGRFANLMTAISFDYDIGQYDFYDCQFLHCLQAFVQNQPNVNLNLYNSLFYNLSDVYFAPITAGGGPNIVAINSTFHNSGELGQPQDGYSFADDIYENQDGLTLVNCLLVGAGTSAFTGAGFYTNFTIIAPSDAGYFQTNGGGQHYLALTSPARGAGTTNIYAPVLADIQGKTTLPPVILSNYTFSASTVLIPEIARDNGATADIGYHYDPIDFAIDKLTVASNVVLTLSNGVVLAEFNVNLYGVPLYVEANAMINSVGKPEALNWLVRYHRVQENVWLAGSPPYQLAILESNVTANLAFTGVALTLNNGQIFTLESQNYISIANSQLFNVSIAQRLPNDYYSIDVFNTLFQRDNLSFWSYNDIEYGGNSDISFQNATFIGGNVTMDLESGTIWTFYDCLFDQASVTQTGWGEVDDSSCAYYQSSDVFYDDGGNVLLTNIDFQTGPLGYYYYPSTGTNLARLINAGDQSASGLGLYHYTTQTNQLKETNTIVDIGFHYVAVNSSGLPISTSGDGIGDYLKDSNGNGIYDSASDLGNWTSNCTCGDGISDYLKYIEGRNLKDCGSVADSTGAIALSVFTPLR